MNMDWVDFRVTGRIVKTPEVRTSSKGDPFCPLRVAVSPEKTQAPEDSAPGMTGTFFMTVNFYEANAEKIGRMGWKGQPVMISGRFRVIDGGVGIYTGEKIRFLVTAESPRTVRLREEAGDKSLTEPQHESV